MTTINSKALTREDASLKERMAAITKPLVLITGANAGIGFAVMENLVNSRKYHVLLGARADHKATAAVAELQQTNPDASSNITPVIIDVTDDASIAGAAEFVSSRFGRLDVLINNAGITISADRPAANRRENLHAVFDTNVFGVASVIDTFLPLLRKSTYPDRRIVNVSTGLSKIAVAYELESDWGARKLPAPEYRSSKAALNMLTAVYAVTLREEGILVVVAAPGYTRTKMTAGEGWKTPAEGARSIVRAATGGDRDELFGTMVADELTECKW
ncbi:short-chain dehydrogenase [Podospora didyma]|uniref:Short-chain dehydrogenase n=1 Tax=Podospora didyma TaxID=330526 RepID=A0AAE0TZF0_9PEZI|nr:short-chain dehydrogenase [Podospora didyma]